MIRQHAAQRTPVATTPGSLQSVPLLPRLAPALPPAPVVADPAMRRVLERIERLAATDIPVLVRGESGTGKEVLVQHLHAIGARAAGPLVAENCAAIPESLA